MLEVLQKSKQLSLIAIHRLGDYLSLIRIEMQLQRRELTAQFAGYLLATLCLLFALLFVGVAVIVTLWDSEYRGVAAWSVVMLYLLMAAGGLLLARQHAGRSAAWSTLREEIRRDMAMVRESL